MFSPGNLDYKKTLQDLFTVTFNLMIIIILKIVAVAYSVSLHVHLTGICDRKEPGLVLPFLFLIWAVPAFHAHSPMCLSLAVGKQRVRALFCQMICLAKLVNSNCQSTSPYFAVFLNPGVDQALPPERRAPVTPSSASRYHRRRSSGSRDERYRSITSLLSIHLSVDTYIVPCLGYCKWCWYEHSGVCIFLNYSFVWIYAQEWDC